MNEYIEVTGVEFVMNLDDEGPTSLFYNIGVLIVNEDVEFIGDFFILWESYKDHNIDSKKEQTTLYTGFGVKVDSIDCSGDVLGNGDDPKYMLHIINYHC